MRRPSIVLIVLLAGGLLLFWLLRGAVERREQGRDETTAVAESAPSKAAAPEQPMPGVPAAAATITPTPGGAGDSDRLRTAYMLQLDAGALTLVQAQDIEGDFAPRRRPREAWTGMLRCQLVSSKGAVIAEEVQSAPDRVCTVLDSQSGASRPVSFTVPGPVVFQVRMPRAADAARLDIFRVGAPGGLARDPLIGSIPLAAR